MKNLKKGSHIYLMGICGTAMASLAGLLQEMGFRVSGSDSNPYPPMSTQLEKLGIPILTPYRAENLRPLPDFVIVGNVIGASNPEAVELLKSKVPYTSLPKALGDLIIDSRESVVIAGTHGKTTTTSLFSWVAEKCGERPGFLIGGIAKNFSQSFRTPQGNLFVIEGDEYDTAFFDKVPKFIHYKPKHVILTSIEFDHADIYADLAAVKKSFAELLRRIPLSGNLLYAHGDKNILDILKEGVDFPRYSYGFSEQADYRIEKISQSYQGQKVKVYFRSESLGEFLIPMSGDYNLLNAASCIALGHQLHWDQAKIRSAIGEFQGVKRRQEILGEPGGVLVIEDFAHHPTAVRETLKGIREKYPQKKIFAVFEPRSATSRRRIFQKEYELAFADADEVILAKAFDQSKIQESERFSSEELAEGLAKRRKSAKVFAEVEEIVADLQKRSHSGDLILIMSNGGFGGIYEKLLKALS